MAVREPQIVDYILSGLAGIGKGVVAGTAQRQERERAEKIQSALEEYRSAALEQGKRQFQQTHAFNVANLWQQRSQFKSGQEFQKEMSRLNLENKKDFAKYEKDLEGGGGWLSKIFGGQKPIDWARTKYYVELANKTRLDAQTSQFELDERRAGEDIASLKLEFDKEKHTDDMTMEMNRVLSDYAMHYSDAVTAAGLAEYRTLSDDWLGRKDIDPLIKNEMKIAADYDLYAMFLTGKKQEAAKRLANDKRKKISELLEVFHGIKYKPGMLEYEKKGVPVLRDIPVIRGLGVGRGAPEITGAEGFMRTEQPAPEVPMPDAGFLQQVFSDIYGQQVQLPLDIDTVITNLKSAAPPVKILTQAHIDALKSKGYSDKQITKIKQGIR